MGITMIFNYVLLALAFLFIMLTRKDGTNEDCHVPAHHHLLHEEHEDGMVNIQDNAAKNDIAMKKNDGIDPTPIY